MLLGSCRSGTTARSTSNPNYSYRPSALLTCSCISLKWGPGFRLEVFFSGGSSGVSGALNGYHY